MIVIHRTRVPGETINQEKITATMVTAVKVTKEGLITVRMVTAVRVIEEGTITARVDAAVISTKEEMREKMSIVKRNGTRRNEEMMIPQR